jgi:hypothetical protein
VPSLRGWTLPWALLVVGSAGSLAANVAVAQPTAAGRVIAAWPSFALIGAYELLMRQVRRTEVGHNHESRVAGFPHEAFALRTYGARGRASLGRTEASMTQPGFVVRAGNFNWARLVPSCWARRAASSTGKATGVLLGRRATPASSRRRNTVLAAVQYLAAIWATVHPARYRSATSPARTWPGLSVGHACAAQVAPPGPR